MVRHLRITVVGAVLLSSQTSSMTPRKRRVRFALRPQSRSYARAPEVCPLAGHGVHEHPVATRLRRLDRLDRPPIVTMHAPTPSARTIQRA